MGLPAIVAAASDPLARAEAPRDAPFASRAKSDAHRYASPTHATSATHPTACVATSPANISTAAFSSSASGGNVGNRSAGRNGNPPLAANARANGR